MDGHGDESRIAELVIREARFGRTKYGTYSLRHEAAAVVLKEVDEFWAAVKDQNTYGQSEEALQVAATAFRFVLAFGDITFLEARMGLREKELEKYGHA